MEGIFTSEFGQTVNIRIKFNKDIHLDFDIVDDCICAKLNSIVCRCTDNKSVTANDAIENSDLYDEDIPAYTWTDTYINFYYTSKIRFWHYAATYEDPEEFDYEVYNECTDLNKDLLTELVKKIPEFNDSVEDVDFELYPLDTDEMFSLVKYQEYEAYDDHFDY